MSQRAAHIAALTILLAACSGSSNNDENSNSPDAGPAIDVSMASCEGAVAEWVTAAAALSRDCAVAADCMLTSTAQCIEYGVRADADFTAANSAESTAQACGELDDWCLNNTSAEIWGASKAGCVNEVCGTVPNFACTFLAPDSLPPVLRSCSSSDDCEVRSDMNPCGCPEAISTLSYDDDTTLAEVGAAFYEAAGEECSLAAKCTMIGCAVGTTAICEAGACVLAP